MNYKGSVLFALFLLAATTVFSQEPVTQQRFQVAVFTPLYLDSAFDQFSNYKHGMNFPKFLNPGLEFYEGIEMAIDSLNSEGIPMDVNIYDSRSQTTIQNNIAQPAFDSVDLIIGHVNASESRLLAGEAAKRKIPFINATYPNDAGVSNNPNFVILNSTLTTHISAMYRFIQKNHALAPVVMFRKKGEQEGRLQQYFTDITKNTNSVPLKIKYVTLDEYFDAEDLKEHLSAGRTTVCIAGSLDVNFGNNLVQHLSTLYTETPSIVFGMPTWWDVTDFTKPEYQKVEVIYTTPFYLFPTSPLVIKIENDFRSRFYSRPTDMVYRGYETLYHFAHLLHEKGKDIETSFSDNRYKLFSEFQIQPVLDTKTNTLDYFENKKIYFIKKVGGVVTAVY